MNSLPTSSLPPPPTMSPLKDIFEGTRGNRHPEILIVGEAWGAEEARLKLPFVGISGRELSKMIFEAKINETTCLLTNLVSTQPPANDFSHFLHPNSEKKIRQQVRGVYPNASLSDGISRLERLIDLIQPKLIVGLGNWPLWALTEGKAKTSTVKGFSLPSGIMSWRGSELQTRAINGQTYNFLPTIHPSAVLRSWDLRRFVVHDLGRAKAFLSGAKPTWEELSFATVPQPTYSEVYAYLCSWLERLPHAPLELSVDIETSKQRFITCLGIADDKVAICIPFFWWDSAGAAQHYWPEDQEVRLWQLLATLLSHPNIRIIGQNFAYDSQFLARMAGIHCKVSFDTMIAHHLCFPGTPKGLDMLASLYLDNYVYWKDESQEWATDNDHLTNWKYNCKDTRYTYDIAQTLKNLIAKFNLTEQYECQLEQWEMAREMSLRGTRADDASKRAVGSELRKILKAYEEFLLACMPSDLRYTDKGLPWFKSNKLSQEILYHYLGITPVLHKKTKRPTFDASSFEPIKKRAPWFAAAVDAIDRYRSVEVFISHFLDAPLSPDGRFRASFNVGGTDTFRLSSNSNPFGEGTNLQNIPKGDK